MKKAKRIIAAVTALLLTTASSSFASVIADSDSGFVSTTASTAANDESDISDAQLYEKLAQLLKQGDMLKYGEALYTTGTPDGEKWTKELYEQRVEFFGEDLLSKYIVDGEFLRKSVESDMKGLLNKTKNELDKYVDIINEYLISNSIAGSAYAIKNDGVDKLLITYDGQLEKIQAYIAEIGVDESLVVYDQAQDMVVTKPATTIAVTETKPVTTITMPVLDDPTIQTAVVTVTVMDVSGDNILVKPVEDSPEFKSSEKLFLSKKKLPDDIKPKVGMKLEITYKGGILVTFPGQFANVQKVVEVKEDTVKEDSTLLKGTKDMTLNDVMRLAEKGDELDWSDFKDYKGRDVGSGLYIWEYKLEDGYVLDVGGDVMKKPLYILLSHNDEKGIDIRTDDVKEYIAASGTPVATGNEEVKSVMLTTESGYEGCYVHLDLMSGTFTMSGSMHQNFAVFGKFERKGNNLYLYGENGSTNVYILHRDGSSLISQSDEKGINLTKGLAFSAENDAFWEKLTSTNESTVKGDANCDTNVNMSDAVIIMQSLANPAKYGVNGTDENHITEQGKINGDIAGNNDGITNADALAIQKKLLGLDEETDSDIVVFEMTPSKTGVDEFLANNPTIKSSYKDDELFNITPQEITDKYGFKIFKYSQNCETYLEYQGEVHQLGTGWGGPGTVSFAIADLNGDKHYELYFTYSWGSGLNHAVIDCFDTSSSSVKFEGFDQYWSDDVVLAVENGKLGVFKAKYTSSGFVSIKAVPTEKLGEITADNETNKVVFVPVNSSDTDLDKSAIAGKIFAYEKEGAGGYCTLSFNENGRFLYSPGKLSSYMDGGDWKIDGDTVSLIGMVGKTIYLKITDDTLVYIAEGSDEFPYMDIKDGEKFAIYRPEISSDKFQLYSRYSEYGLGNPKVELNLIASELPEFCYVENVRLYDEDDNFIGMMSPAMDADIWSYLVDCNITEECSKTYYTLTKIRCGQKTYLDDVRSEITVNFKVTPVP